MPDAAFNSPKEREKFRKASMREAKWRYEDNLRYERRQKKDPRKEKEDHIIGLAFIVIIIIFSLIVNYC